MYVDLDLHMGDAVAEAFSSSAEGSAGKVLTLSIHHTSRGFFPATPRSDLSLANTSDLYTLSVPLRVGASNATYAAVWKSAVEPIKEAFNPDIIVVQCGADALSGDPYATFNWGISVDIEGSMGWCVQQVLNWNRKTLLLGGGE